jgi:hypothetical protein
LSISGVFVSGLGPLIVLIGLSDIIFALHAHLHHLVAISPFAWRFFVDSGLFGFLCQAKFVFLGRVGDDSVVCCPLNDFSGSDPSACCLVWRLLRESLLEVV